MACDNNDNTRGIITIALGSQVYLDMARDLAFSLKLHCPHIPRAVLTDATGSALTRLFDIVIPYRPEYRHGLYPKLCLDQYTPFHDTLYIDGDSLVLRNVDFIWHLCKDQEFAVVGEVRSTGHWYMDIPVLLARLGLTSIPTFNSGMFVVKRGEVVSRIFRRARAIYDDESYAFDSWHNSRSDEICFAIALAEEGIQPVPDAGTTMRTPIGIRGDMDIDVLAGKCIFDKHGEKVSPAIAHFATWQFHPIYYRERAKLRLIQAPKLLRPLARVGARMIYYRERALHRLHKWHQRVHPQTSHAPS